MLKSKQTTVLLTKKTAARVKRSVEIILQYKNPVQSGKRFVEIILLTKKSAARVKRRVEIICKKFVLTEKMALPGKRSVENILLTKNQLHW